MGLFTARRAGLYGYVGGGGACVCSTVPRGALFCFVLLVVCVFARCVCSPTGVCVRRQVAQTACLGILEPER